MSVSCTLVHRLALAARCFSTAPTLAPTIALVGRQNVGKSTMFNRLTGRHSALVFDTPFSHVTRDYKEGMAQLSDLSFRLIDTSGAEPEMTDDAILGRATTITKRLLRDVSAALFLVDAKTGLTAQDWSVARWLRTELKGKAVVVVASKCDHFNNVGLVSNAWEAASLGFDEVVLYSAETGAGTADLYDALKPIVDAHARRCDTPVPMDEDLDGATASERTSGDQNSSMPSPQKFKFHGWKPNEGLLSQDNDSDANATRKSYRERRMMKHSRAHEVQGATPSTVVETLGQTAPIKLAIMGLPNVGKSTLLNTLVGFDRVVTGPEPGLTRDSVAVRFQWQGNQFEMADTAGWLKRSPLTQFDDSQGRVAALTMAQSTAKLAFSHAVFVLVDAHAIRTRWQCKASDADQVLLRRELDLCDMVMREGRLLLLGVNKIDLLTVQERHQLRHALEQQIDRSLSNWKDCVSVFPITATTGRGVDAAFERLLELLPRWSSIIPTAKLNRWRQQHQADMAQGAVSSVRFLKMISARPPTVIAEVKKKVTDTTYPLTLSRSIRNAFDLRGVPIRVVLVSKLRRRAPATERPARRRAAAVSSCLASAGVTGALRRRGARGRKRSLRRSQGSLLATALSTG